jgi:hypothetical protein
MAQSIPFMICASSVEVPLAAPDGSLLGQLFYRVGYAAGQIESYIGTGGGDGTDDDTAPRRRHRARRHPGVRHREPGTGPDQTAPPARARRRVSPSEVAEIRARMEDAIKDAAETWFVSRVLRPRSLSWPAVLFAGLAATTLSDVVAFFTVPGRPNPYDEEPETLVARYGAGIATTAAYAAVLYPRLPGRPLTRGFLFGLLDVVTEPEGGLIALGRRLAPDLHFPLKPFALPVNEDAGPMARLAFGFGLGLFYRSR